MPQIHFSIRLYFVVGQKKKIKIKKIRITSNNFQRYKNRLFFKIINKLKIFEFFKIHISY